MGRDSVCACVSWYLSKIVEVLLQCVLEECSFIYFVLCSAFVVQVEKMSVIIFQLQEIVMLIFILYVLNVHAYST